MRRGSRLALGALAALFALGAAGCGALTGPSANGTSGGQTIEHISPAASVTPAGSATPAAHGPVTGQVTLTLDKARYGVNDPILVTIYNGYNQTVYAADHRTGCTVATLERLEGGVWQPMNMCRLLSPTVLTPLAATTAAQVRLSVTSSTGGWTPGAYRVTYTYGGGDEGANGSAGPGATIHSAQFTVG